MQSLIQIASGDRRLLADIANTMDEAVRRSGEWVVCRAGCPQCCIGPFAITPLDAWRLQQGLGELQKRDPARAGRVLARADAYAAACVDDYSGGGDTTALWQEDRLPASMENVACPALDPETGCCDLYDARPITCRTFGPATRLDDGNVGACELCYVGATDQQVEECAVDLDPKGLEGTLLDEFSARGMTLVAYALLTPDEAQCSD